jgi:aconitate hydratase
VPLEFAAGESAQSLGLTGDEVFSIEGIAAGLTPKKQLTVRAGDKTFTVTARVDTPQEVEYLLHGGILQYVVRTRAKLLAAGKASKQ